MALAVGALLVGALVILFLPSFSFSSFRSEPTAPAAASTDAPAVPLAEPVVVPAAASAEAGTVTDHAPLPAMSNTAPATPTAPAPGAAAPASPAAAGPNAAPQAPSGTTPAVAGPATGIVIFKATGPSWIEVMDSKGNVALRRLLAAGESAGATGALPLAVTVGSVSTTAVEVRGKPFDLGRLARDNVARFEVK